MEGICKKKVVRLCVCVWKEKKKQNKPYFSKKKEKHTTKEIEVIKAREKFLI